MGNTAFDLVAHDSLVKRLDNYFGFSATVFDWFKSVIAHRSQSVTLGNAGQAYFYIILVLSLVRPC